MSFLEIKRGKQLNQSNVIRNKNIHFANALYTVYAKRCKLTTYIYSEALPVVGLCGGTKYNSVAMLQ